ncbi:hypothetical protein [Sorangium sp. So ce1389]|uniref:hypothetical protein n=1 Tax=Sorangium sp. So ce1389 TaxID=3133336 RepID=UPI003F612B37
MNRRRRSKASLLKRARDALDLIGRPIEHDWGKTTGAEDIETGLDAMATALAELKGLESAGGSLDEALAEMGIDESTVHTAAELIEQVGQVDYAGGLQDPASAESLRQDLYLALEQLLGTLGGEQSDE